jgi:hypothetical protein
MENNQTILGNLAVNLPLFYFVGSDFRMSRAFVIGSP